MSAQTTESDEDLLEGVADWGRPCLPWGESHRDCPREARWLVTKACCRMELPLCYPHMERARVEIIERSTCGGPTECYGCGDVTVIRDRSWFRVVPINRGNR